MDRRSFIALTGCLIILFIACTPISSDNAPDWRVNCLSANYTDAKSLMRNPPPQGSCYAIEGEVTQRLAREQFIVNTGGQWEFDNRALIVGTNQCVSGGGPDRVLEGDYVSFMARFDRLYQGKTELGAPMELPVLYCKESMTPTGRATAKAQAQESTLPLIIGQTGGECDFGHTGVAFSRTLRDRLHPGDSVGYRAEILIFNARLNLERTISCSEDTGESPVEYVLQILTETELKHWASLKPYTPIGAPKHSTPIPDTTPTPIEPTPLEVGSDCDQLLKNQLVFQRGASTATRMNEVIRQIQAQRDDCLSELWDPTVDDSNAYADSTGCWAADTDAQRQDNPKVGDITVPAGLYDGRGQDAKVRANSGRDADNNVIVYWSNADGKSPSDGASCWLYVSRLNIWDKNYQIQEDRRRLPEQ